ncbi:ATP-binding protein [Niallia taxi]|uniref:histidine kinase n=2 Tax=Bacillati TaxID=1783272 RepID=A0A3S2UW15_9BACI|nr:HAMP domain-containing sensor histidine kinase [Niallia taxi]MCM3217258.1 HAMP domain-containing histidine kinase [Niallia taxi]MDK8643592.1 HAMP domain-containing sensor histidine kinase [Niallia taxi]MED4038831.1 HAMP domain-containing sensor histidine kinase [Niallia taxi]MED4053907.1 HAMP domain-containing sensor histidine kinase [Niallia taxi]MED4120465.1 HAMP domain-containing sensor histidine kinase [Niallia taxi]
MNSYKDFNVKVYYGVIAFIIMFMVSGMVASFFMETAGLRVGNYLNAVEVVLLSVLLLLYPKISGWWLNFLIIIVGTSYFYTIFYVYPDTWSSFIFVCFIPAISILFFDKQLFIFSMVMNICLYFLGYAYILFMDKAETFGLLGVNVPGNIINFLGSQALLYCIFLLTYERIKKQQLYYKQLQQSERLKTTGQLAAAVAHEIRNPLTVVKGFLQLYQQEEKMDEGSKRNYSLMIDELNTAEHVLSQFLMLAKPDNDIKLEKVEVESLLQSVTDLVKSYGILRDNNIFLHHVEKDCYILVNIIEFKQLMINLLKNAMEASPYGEPIFIESEIQKDMVEIKVTDHGCGMSEEEVQSLGTPFYSLKSKGTGLGMMICFNIVEKYNGKINIESKKGEGTAVKIQFPIVKNP